jgi:putative chitinase
MNRKTLFDRLRARPFGGVLTQGQVDGINTILDAWERHYRQRTGIAQLGYCLGTTFHETARTMQPIKEYGDTAYFMRMYDKAGSRPNVATTLGNTEAGDGARFPGRGLVQLTGRDNHRRATRRLRELGIIGNDIDFEANPDLVMRPDLACHIMFIGMEEGWFTGAKLDTIIDDVADGDEHADFISARKIINGTDRAELIAGNSDDFLKALIAAEAATPEPEIIPPVAGQPQINPLTLILGLVALMQRSQQPGGLQQQDIMAFLQPLLQGLGGPQPLQLPGPGGATPQPDLTSLLGQVLRPPPTIEQKPPEPKPAPANEGFKVSRPSVWASILALGGSVLGIDQGVIGTPLGFGMNPTATGTASVIGPLITMALGAAGAFVPGGSVAVKALGGLGRLLSSLGGSK